MLVAGNDISGSGNGITMEYNGVARNNWVHDLGHMAGDHHSGLSNHGGAKHVVFRHNTALLDGASYPGGGGLSGALTVYSDFAHAQNVTLKNNLISGGSYVIYGGNSGDDVTTRRRHQGRSTTASRAATGSTDPSGSSTCTPRATCGGTTTATAVWQEGAVGS